VASISIGRHAIAGTAGLDVSLPAPGAVDRVADMHAPYGGDAWCITIIPLRCGVSRLRFRCSGGLRPLRKRRGGCIAGEAHAGDRIAAVSGADITQQEA
jgi:hypothetical protein